jgi:hypothetical protein
MGLGSGVKKAPDPGSATLKKAVFRIRVRVFGPPGSGSKSVIICTDPDPEPDLSINKQKN